MMSPKKLQIFVSSTYTDLREERQAAVEAVLSAGHIPAGMELFAAGDESQMAVIRRWIDESDIFLLILGGRYGSLDPATQKSYTHLEYEYALDNGKPLFAVVIEAAALEKRVKKAGTKVVEIENASKLEDFRRVVLGKMSRFWSDPRDIRLAIYEALGEFIRRRDLVGWIRADEAVSASLLAEEVARLTKENSALRVQLAEQTGAAVTYNGLTFEQLCGLLRREKIDLTRIPQQGVEELTGIALVFGDPECNLLHTLWFFRHDFMPETKVDRDDPLHKYMDRYIYFGLITLKHSREEETDVYAITSDGQKFLLRLLSVYGEAAPKSS